MSRPNAAQRAIIRERDRILREDGTFHDIESSDYPDELLADRGARPTEHYQDQVDYVDLLRDTIRFSRVGGDRRTIAELRIEGYSFTEIAEATGISRRKCWQAIQDVLRLSRQRLVDRGDPGMAAGFVPYHKIIYNRNTSKSKRTQRNHVKREAEEQWTAANVPQQKKTVRRGRIPRFCSKKPSESSG